MSSRFQKPRLLVILATLLLVGGGTFWFVQQAYGVTRTWDGGGTDGTCGGGAGDGNKWTCAANWTGDTVPTSADTAVFDGTSTKNATINANLSGGTAPAGISINAGYTGTITQATGVTIAIGSSGFSQAAGTFTGGNSAITLNGAFTLSGGTFTSTSGTLVINGVNFTHTAGGTWNHNNGTVDFGTNGNTIDVATNETFYNFTLWRYNGAASSIASGDTLIVLATYNHSNGNISTGTIEVRGNMLVSAVASGGSTTVSFLVSGDQTITSSGGSTGALNINKSSGSVSVTGSLGIKSFTLTSGTFNAPTGTLAIDGGSWTHTAGGTFNHNNGTVNFGTDGNVIDVATNETFYNFTLSRYGGAASSIASGDTLIVLATYNHSNAFINTGTIEVRGNMLVSAIAGGGNTTVSFLVSGDQTITSSGGSTGALNINKSSGSVSVTGNIEIYGFTLANGTFYAPTGTLSVRVGGWTHTVGGTFIHNNGTVILCDATYDVSSIETFYRLTTSRCGAGPATIASGDTLIVLGIFTLSGGNVSLSGGTIEARGDVVIEINTTGGSTLLSFTGTGDQTYTDQGGNEMDGDITINKPVGTVVNLASDADWNATNQDLTITSGILNLGSYTLRTGGTLTVSSNGVLHGFSTGDLILGGNVSNSGIIRLESNGACGSTDSISITSSTGGVQRTWSGTGTITLYDVSIQDQGGTRPIQVMSGTSVSGNGTNFVFQSVCNFNTLTNGLVGYWPMSEGTGTTTADMSGSGYTGTFTNGPTWTTGQIGNGVNMSGSNKYISVGNMGALPSQGTIAFWMNPAQIVSYLNPFTTYYGGGDNAIRFEMNGSGGFYAYIGNGTNAAGHVYTNNLVANRWYFVVLVWNSGSNNVIGYFDGSQIFNEGHSYWPATMTSVAIGWGYENARSWIGSLDEVRIYNRALTPAEAQTLYYNVRPEAAGLPSGKMKVLNGKMRIQ